MSVIDQYLPERRRAAPRKDLVGASLLTRILEGQLKPGDRLPVRRSIQRDFAASPVTVERAFASLVHDGFLETRGRGGTFVTRHPPHLFQFGLIFATHQNTRFSTALRHQAEIIGHEQPHRFTVYAGMDGHMDEPDCRRLVRDLRNGCLAGLFCGHEVAVGFMKGLCASSPIPIATITDDQSVRYRISLDRHEWLTKALDSLQKVGRKRVAVLMIPGGTPDLPEVERLTRAIRDAGMETDPAWIQAVATAYPHWAHHALSAMLQGAPASRPDGLIITDDHLVEPATQSLRRLGLHDAKAFSVIAHCNYPELPAAARPVTWLGFDSHLILNTAVELMRRTPPRDGLSASIPAWFEHEWKERRSLRTAAEGDA